VVAAVAVAVAVAVVAVAVAAIIMAAAVVTAMGNYHLSWWLSSLVSFLYYYSFAPALFGLDICEAVHTKYLIRWN
jgi:hypothetical protein